MDKLIVLRLEVFFVGAVVMDRDPSISAMHRNGYVGPVLWFKSTVVIFGQSSQASLILSCCSLCFIDSSIIIITTTALSVATLLPFATVFFSQRQSCGESERLSTGHNTIASEQGKIIQKQTEKLREAKN